VRARRGDARCGRGAARRRAVRARRGTATRGAGAASRR